MASAYATMASRGTTAARRFVRWTARLGLVTDSATRWVITSDVSHGFRFIFIVYFYHTCFGIFLPAHFMYQQWIFKWILSNLFKNTGKPSALWMEDYWFESRGNMANFFVWFLLFYKIDIPSLVNLFVVVHGCCSLDSVSVHLDMAAEVARPSTVQHRRCLPSSLGRQTLPCLESAIRWYHAPMTAEQCICSVDTCLATDRRTTSGNTGLWTSSGILFGQCHPVVPALGLSL